MSFIPGIENGGARPSEEGEQGIDLRTGIDQLTDFLTLFENPRDRANVVSWTIVRGLVSMLLNHPEIGQFLPVEGDEDEDDTDGLDLMGEVLSIINVIIANTLKGAETDADIIAGIDGDDLVEYIDLTHDALEQAEDAEHEEAIEVFGLLLDLAAILSLPVLDFEMAQVEVQAGGETSIITLSGLYELINVYESDYAAAFSEHISGPIIAAQGIEATFSAEPFFRAILGQNYSQDEVAQFQALVVQIVEKQQSRSRRRIG